MDLKEKTTIKSYMYIIIAIVIALVIMKISIPSSIAKVGEAQLTQTGQTALAVLVFSLILWITEAIPFHITGLLGIFMLALFKVDTFKTVVKEGFGNDIFIFFIGVLILSSFITKSGFGKRISLFILSKTGNDPKKIILGFLITGALLSMWVTNMAVAAMLLPLGKGILNEENVIPKESNFGKALMIACAWGPVIGGIGTPAGAGPNPVAIGFLKDMAGINISFIDWLIYGFPSAILLLLPTWWVILLFFKPEMKKLSKTKEEMQEEYKNYPKMNREEKVTLTLFILTVALWLSSPLLERIIGIAIPISMPVIFTTSLFFFPKISGIKWKEIQREMDWSGIILVVSGISIGIMIYQTGVAQWFAVVLLGGIGSLSSFVQIFVIILMVSLLKVIFSSNTVTATVIIPIIIAMAQNQGLDIFAITLPAALTTSMAFILVTSSPTNVIPYSAGYFSISDMAKAGLVLTLVSSLIVAITVYCIRLLIGIF